MNGERSRDTPLYKGICGETGGILNQTVSPSIINHEWELERQSRVTVALGILPAGTGGVKKQNEAGTNCGPGEWGQKIDPGKKSYCSPNC